MIEIRDGHCTLKQIGDVAEIDIRDLMAEFVPSPQTVSTQFFPHEDRTCAMISSGRVVDCYAMYLAPKRRKIRVNGAQKKDYILTWPHTYLFIYCPKSDAVRLPTGYFARCAGKKITSKHDILGDLPMPNISPTNGKICNGSTRIPDFIRDRNHSMLDIVEQYPQIFVTEPFKLEARNMPCFRSAPQELLSAEWHEKPAYDGESESVDTPGGMRISQFLAGWEEYSEKHTPEEVCQLSWNGSAGSVRDTILVYVN